MDALPDTGLLPIAQPSPAGHAAAAAHLLRQVLPRHAGLQDEKNPGQHRAIGRRLAARKEASPRLRWRQQRTDPLPQRVVQDGLGQPTHPPADVLLLLIGGKGSHEQRFVRRSYVPTSILVDAGDAAPDVKAEICEVVKGSRYVVRVAWRRPISSSGHLHGSIEILADHPDVPRKRIAFVSLFGVGGRRR